MAKNQTDDYSSIILKKTSPILNLISVVLGSQDLNATNKKKTKKSKNEKDDRVLVMLKAGLNMMAVKISNLNTSFGFIKTISDLFIRSEDLVVSGTHRRTPLAIEQLEGTSPSDVFGSNLSFGPSNIFEKFVDHFATQDVGLTETGVIGNGIAKTKIASTYEFEQSVNFLTESSDIGIKENLNLSFETNPSIQFIEKPDKIRKLSFEAATESVIIQRQELLLKVLESNQILDDILYDQESVIADSFYTELPEQKFEYFDRIPGNPSNDESIDESEENEIRATNPITPKRKRRNKTLVEPDIPEEPGHVGWSVFIPENTTHINQSDSEPLIEDSKTAKDDRNRDTKDDQNHKEHPTIVIEDHSTITETSNVQVEQTNSQVPYPIIQIDDINSQAEASSADISESNAAKEDPYSKIEDIYTQIKDLDTEIVGLYTEITGPIDLIVDTSTEPLEEKSQQEDLQQNLEEQIVLTPEPSLPSDQIDENEATKQPIITKSVPNMVKDLINQMQNKSKTKTEKEDANTQDIKVGIPQIDIGIQKFTSQVKDLYTRRKAAFLAQGKSNSQDQDIPLEANNDIVECKSKDNNNMEPLQNLIESDYEVRDVEVSKKSKKATSIGSKILEVVLEKDTGHQQNIVGTFIISQNLKMGDKIKEAKLVRMLREQFSFTTMLRLDEEIKIQVDRTKLLTFYKIQLNTH